MFAMLTGRLPFLVDPPNNLQKLHALILRGAKMPDFLTKGKSPHFIMFLFLYELKLYLTMNKSLCSLHLRSLCR